MAEPNGLNPNFDRISFNGSPVITGGTANGDTAIKAAVGTLPAGSWYFSSGTSTPSIWSMVSTTWTQII